MTTRREQQPVSHSHGHDGTAGLQPVGEYLAEILAAVRPLPPARLALEEAEGGVLAEDTATTTPLPSFDNSAMDGYAVHAADLAGAAPAAPVTLPVTDEIPAGDTRDLDVAAGTCVRIMTGARMPGGADAVVPVEWTDGGTRQARFSSAVEAGHAIRHRGDDVPGGEILLTAGTRLGPPQIALLAAGGHGSALVRPRPRVAVIATGNELTEPGTPIVPGRIWDSNSYLLAAAARQAGAVAQRHRVGDDPQTVLKTLADQAARADVLVTSGGVSMGGEHDVVKAALADLGTVTFRKVAMQPGMPQGFGVLGPDRTPVFTLPGNPVSAFVSFCLFVRPALTARQGLTARPPAPVRAVLTEPVRSPAGKTSFLRGVLDSGGVTVAPLTGQSSHQLGALSRANALIVVPEQVTAMQAGEVADVLCLP
ncbi:MAG: molybdopterin molybdotransferase MoeA [Actinobacteria bacterium]|nr:molybdopterin molybdotransferase MoeA [Actinomycetota bacterium]